MFVGVDFEPLTGLAQKGDNTIDAADGGGVGQVPTDLAQRGEFIVDTGDGILAILAMP